MTKTVYFDLGNVLVFFSYPRMVRQIADCAGLTVQEVEHILLTREVKEAYETGKIDSAGLYKIFHSTGRKTFSFQELMEAASDIFTPNTELRPLVETLKAKGVRLILLSNTCECHFHRIYSHYPILQLFDDYVLSYRVGAVKPNPLIFQKALALANCPPSQCFYTDDIPEFIASAGKCGLAGEVFSDNVRLREQLQTRGLI